MTDSQRSFLETVYKECNEHAREQPKRRDSIITIYIAVYAAFLGLFFSGWTISPFMVYGLGFIMLLFGATCANIAINFRLWAVQYVSCAKALSALILTENWASDPKEIMCIIIQNIEKTANIKKPFFKRTENIVVIGFIFLTATPIFTIADSLVTLSIIWKAIISATYILSYVIISTIHLDRKIRIADRCRISSKDNKTRPTWIIDFCDPCDKEKVG